MHEMQDSYCGTHSAYRVDAVDRLLINSIYPIILLAKCGHKGELSAVFSAIYYLKSLIINVTLMTNQQGIRNINQ